MAGSISVHCVVQCLLPFLPSSQFLLFTPLPAFLSYAGAQLGVNLGESASPGDIHLVSISKLPPLVPLIKLLTFPAFSGLQYLYFPLASLQLLAFILFQYLNFPPVPLNNFLHSFGFICGNPVASPQFLASILFQCSKALTHLCLSATSCIHAVSISRLLPLVSPQLLACIVIGVQYLCTHMVFEYLYFPPALASPQTYCVHLVSISKLPPQCPSTTSCIHLASISKLPPQCPSGTS